MAKRWCGILWNACVMYRRWEWVKVRFKEVLARQLFYGFDRYMSLKSCLFFSLLLFYSFLFCPLYRLFFSLLHLAKDEPLILTFTPFRLRDDHRQRTEDRIREKEERKKGIVTGREEGRKRPKGRRWKEELYCQWNLGWQTQSGSFSEENNRQITTH